MTALFHRPRFHATIGHCALSLRRRQVLAALMILVWVLPAGPSPGLTAETGEEAVDSFDRDAAFESANKLYETGRFDEASQSYRAILRHGETSAALLFNLANASHKTGKIGEAILLYRQALKLAPRDPDIRANLNFVRAEVQKSTGQTAEVWNGPLGQLRLDEWTLLTAGLLWIWCLIMTIRESSTQRRQSWHRPALASGLVLVGAACCLGWTAHEHLSKRDAIVTVSQASVRFGPLPESQEHFTVQDGEEVVILDRKGDWARIHAGADRFGWILAHDIEEANSSDVDGILSPD